MYEGRLFKSMRNRYLVFIVMKIYLLALKYVVQLPDQMFFLFLYIKKKKRDVNFHIELHSCQDDFVHLHHFLR